jgi:tRNA(Ile)-lysidine synthase
MGKYDSLHHFFDQCMFPSNGPIHCAVSGGADSSALLILASMTGEELIAHHVDHGLRPNSSIESDSVARLANQVGAKFRSVTLSLEEGPNLEARARSARFAALPDDVLTGHTADDQAETIILHLLRGGGPDALAGMGDEHHPIIKLRRADTESVCQIFEWKPVEDPTNEDPRFRRNRVRHEVLPLLNEVAERDVVPLLIRAGEIADKDADLLDRLAQEIDVTDAAALATAPIALARRSVREWLRGEHPPDLASVERVLQVARGEALGTEITGGRSVRRTNGKLRLETLLQEHGQLPESG